MTKIELIWRAIRDLGTASRHEIKVKVRADVDRPTIGPLIGRLEKRGVIEALPAKEQRGARGRLVTVYRCVAENGVVQHGLPVATGLDDPHHRLARLLRAAAAELETMAS